METGRKGRLKVIKSMEKKLKRYGKSTEMAMDFDRFIAWLMTKHGYSKTGAMRLFEDMRYANVLKLVRMKEREREGKTIRSYGVSLISLRKRRASRSSTGNDRVTEQK